MLVVTTAEIPGYRIEAVLGDVIGYGYAFQPPMGQPPLDPMMRSRDQAIQAMWAQATQRGANAVVGHRLTAVGEATTRVFALGTAVAIVPIPQGQPGATPQSSEDARQRASAQARPDAGPMPGQYTQPGQPPQPGQYAQPPQPQYPPNPSSTPSAGYPRY